MAKDHRLGNAEYLRQSPLTFAGLPVERLLDRGRARQAALLLLDTLGVYVAAHRMEAGQIARTAACRLFGAGAPEDQAPLPLDGRLCSRAGMAYAAATQIDNLDAHDGYNPTKGHIGCALVPALLAEAHGRHVSGAEALAALVVGYEIAGRAGIALHRSVADYHSSGAWNGLGVAAACARLRGLSAEQLRQAWGIAEYHGPRSQMMREIANPSMLHDGSGMGALVGLSAATLAEMGFTGAPALTVEAAEAAECWEDLGRFWQLDHQYIKPYPVCRWAHAAIDAMRELRSAHALQPGEIERLEIRSFRNAVALVSGVPRTTSEAQYSLGFGVASMAVHGSIGLPEISGAGLADPAVADLVPRIIATQDPRFEQRYPEGRWAEVAITLRDGKVLTSGEVQARGGPEHPLSEDEIGGKFLEFTAPVLGDARAKSIWTAGLNLPKSDFAAFTALLASAP
ncbi:MAG: MmgE/PrpD family protein [Rhodospirillales bacterium]|nr:MmgE/PrpD family protein [Rhodospirillales bacterium]